MIEYHINPKLDSIDWSRLTEVFELVNWGFRDPTDIEATFRKSSITCFAILENKIVGFGRTVDDGKYYAHLVDIAIDPEHQLKGIGKAIVDKLTSNLKGYNFITLTSAPNKELFYQKLGWKQQKSAYILPKDEKQSKEHC